MGVFRLYRNWRRGYWRPFAPQVSGTEIGDKLNAIEYELQALNRDLARVGYTAPETNRTTASSTCG